MSTPFHTAMPRINAHFSAAAMPFDNVLSASAFTPCCVRANEPNSSVSSNSVLKRFSVDGINCPAGVGICALDMVVGGRWFACG